MSPCDKAASFRGDSNLRVKTLGDPANQECICKLTQPRKKKPHLVILPSPPPAPCASPDEGVGCYDWGQSPLGTWELQNPNWEIFGSQNLSVTLVIILLQNEHCLILLLLPGFARVFPQEGGRWCSFLMTFTPLCCPDPPFFQGAALDALLLWMLSLVPFYNNLPEISRLS